MKEKFFIKPYFENLFSQKRNISLKSLEFLPSEIKLYLDYYLKNVKALYKQKVFPVSLKPSSQDPEEIFLIKDEKIPTFEPKDFILLILPTEKVRYIFQTLVEENLDETYRLKILDPRTEKRYRLAKSIPVFFSYLSPKNILTFFSQENYLFIRDSNFSSFEELERLKEIYFFDLILNSKEQLEEDFVKTINKIHFKGELIDISRGGLCAKTFENLFFLEKNSFLYVRFQIEVSQVQVFKFGLLCHLRILRTQNTSSYLHLMFLLKFNSEIWEILGKRFNSILVQ